MDVRGKVAQVSWPVVRALLMGLTLQPGVAVGAQLAGGALASLCVGRRSPSPTAKPRQENNTRG